jgi:hypothetical protein
LNNLDINISNQNELSLEMSLFRIVDAIMWKEKWEKKIDDDDIVEKWRVESKNSAAFDTAILMLKSMIARKGYDVIKGVKLSDMIDHRESLIPKKLAHTCREVFRNYENVMKKKEFDYHPGSKDIVIDLVHPSLYCLVNGVSVIDGKLSKKPDDSTLTYQWLPSEVYVGKDHACFLSYINNLDTKNKHMYELIGEVFFHFVPLFEGVLGIDMKDSQCQVIVKLTNIIFTERKSDYYGETWHVKGMPHENIVATGIYYYDIGDNTSPSKIEFRRALQRPTGCSQNVMKERYGITDGQILNEHLGEIKTYQNNVVVFPNYLQHHLKHFHLDNHETKGYQKILVFFLINPNTKIVSTENVLPQQATMPLQEAIQHRLKSMAVRKTFIRDLNENIFEDEISLCKD